MPNDYAVPEDAAPPSGEIPHPVRPMLPRQGWILPYRGLVAHGVDPNISPPEAVADLWDEGQVPLPHQGESAPSVRPVPVRVINESSREIKAFFVAQEVATGMAAAIAGLDVNRTKLSVKNIGTVRVWVGPDSKTSRVNGYPIDPEGSQDFSGGSAVYAVSDDGSAQVLAVYGEYTITP